MLDVLNVVFSTQKGIRRYQAPKGKVYDIRGFACANIGTAGNEILVSASQVEDNVVVMSPNRNLIFITSLPIAGANFSINLPEGIKTKYLSIGPRLDININCTLLIYYELVTASKAELVWEFISRGKNP